MINLIGKHTVKIFDRKNQLVKKLESYNVITNKGRERILDIWAFNINQLPNSKTTMYGLEMVDTSPAVITGGTRKCTMFDIGTLSDPESDTSSGTRNCDYYNAMLKYTSAAATDAIFNPGNTVSALWSGGAGDNIYHMTRYHTVDLARVQTEETFVVNTTSTDQTITLIGKNIKFDASSSNRYYALKVWNNSKTSYYTYSTDYTFDRANGTVLIKKTGNIPNGATIKIEYYWHDVSLFGDGIVGMSLVGWPDPWHGSLHWFSVMGNGRMSSTGGENWLKRSWPWDGRPYYPCLDWRTESADYTMGCLFMDDIAIQPGHEHMWVTYPYICTNPTNFTFVVDVGGGYSRYNIQNMNFYKPAYQPQTPRVIALGTGDSAPTAGDTALGTEALRLDVYATERPSNGLGRWKAYIDYDQGYGITFKEVGLFFGNNWKSSNLTPGGWEYMKPIVKSECTNLFSRSLYDNPGWSKTADQRVELTYEVQLI